MKHFFLLLLISQSLYAKVIVLSPPKAGTHMMLKALALLGVEANYQHPTYANKFQTAVDEQHPDCTCIVIIRDPRDNILSFYHNFWERPFALERQQRKLGMLSYSAADFPLWKTMTPNERILACIQGGRLAAIRTHFCILNLLAALPAVQNHPRVHIFKYEDLVGPKGGGSLAKQEAEVRRLCAVVKGDQSRIPDVIANLYGPGGNFRKGKSGAWRLEFTPQHIRAFKNSAWNHWLHYWGYSWY